MEMVVKPYAVVHYGFCHYDLSRYDFDEHMAVEAVLAIDL
jgi:hypothetical protein